MADDEVEKKLREEAHRLAEIWLGSDAPPPLNSAELQFSDEMRKGFEQARLDLREDRARLAAELKQAILESEQQIAASLDRMNERLCESLERTDKRIGELVRKIQEQVDNLVQVVNEVTCKIESESDPES